MTIGVKGAYVAPLATDTDSATTYGAVTQIDAPVEISVTPNSTDPNIMYAGDDEVDRIYPDPDITVALELEDLPLWIQRRILGYTLDANGVTVKAATDEPPYYAVGIKATKRNGTYRYIWLYKCVAKPITETFRTKEGGTITRQTGKVEFSAIKRISDDRYMVVADDNVDGFTGGSTFFSTVYETTPASVTMLHTLTWAVTAPVTGETPDTTMSATGYTGAVTWTPTASTFAASTVYTAVVVIAAAAGYVFSPYLNAAAITSLPTGATVERVDDATLRITAIYDATAGA